MFFIKSPPNEQVHHIIRSSALSDRHTMTSHAVMPEMLVDDRISIPACRLLHQVHTQPEWSSIVILIDYPIISISLHLYNTHLRSYIVNKNIEIWQNWMISRTDQRE